MSLPPLLLALTIRGTLVLAMVWLLDRAFRRRMSACSRRVWWILVPVSFLLPAGWPIFPAPAKTGMFANASVETEPDSVPGIWNGATADSIAGHGHALSIAGVLGVLWLAGVIVFLLVVAVRTARVSRYWARMRLSTNPALMGLLEDCKAVAGITTPIGIVVSDEVPAPALLGWLRPRILLPASFVAAAGTQKLRAVLLHELAHFRSLDIPLHWLQTLACAAHWFNPFAHAGVRAWMRFREEAADETAIAWLGGRDATEYGEALVEVLKHSRTFSLPLGALAMGESNKNLKQRMIMILNHAQKTPCAALALALFIGLAGITALLPVRADNPPAAATDAKAADTIKPAPQNVSILESSPDSDVSKTLKMYLQTNQLQAAADFLETCLNNGTLSSTADYYNLVVMHINLDQNEKAASLLETFLHNGKMEASKYSNWELLANIYQQLDNTPKAIATFREAMSHFPTNGNIDMQIGYLYFSMQQYRPALDAMLAATKKEVPSKKLPALWSFIAYLDLKLKEYDAGMEAINKSLEIDPNSKNAKAIRAFQIKV